MLEGRFQQRAHFSSVEFHARGGRQVAFKQQFFFRDLLHIRAAALGGKHARIDGKIAAAFDGARKLDT